MATGASIRCFRHLAGGSAGRRRASRPGFDDNLIYEFIKNQKCIDSLQLVPQDREECLSNFKLWREKEDKVGY